MSERKPFEFVPSDFYDEMDSSGYQPAKACADAANQLLQKWLSDSPAIYCIHSDKYGTGAIHPAGHRMDFHTHRARLVQIESLAENEK